MDDLISRRAAIEALGERPLIWSDDDEFALGERSQYDSDKLAIETVPSADVVPVVRCKDCENWQTDWAPSTAAPDFRYCRMIDGCTQAHDYCSKGKKKDGDPDA